MLQKNNISFTKIHDLGELLRLSVNSYPALNELKENLDWLTIFSVEFRYPGEFALKEDAEHAYSIMIESWNKILPLVS